MSDSPAAILHNTSSVEVGTATDPLRVDPTGTTAQPVTDNGGSLTVDGTVGISGTVPVSGPLTDAQLRATPVPVSGTVTTNAGTGPWPVTDNGGSLTVDAASLPLPTGAATAALQTQPGVDIGDVTVNNGAGAGAVNIQDGGNSLTVDGAVSVSNFPATQPISAVSLPLPTGAATETTLAAINTKTPALGQAAMAASTPVVIASNQSGVPVTDNGGSLTVDGTVAISGSVAVTGPLTDAQLRATAVPVSDGGGSLTVDGTVAVSNFPATQPVSAVSLPLPTGAATSALQTTGNTSLSNIDGKLPAALVGARLDINNGAWLGSTAPTVGQKAMASSLPVTFATDQSAIAISTTGGEEATYTVIASAAAAANNKSMLSIYNPTGSGYVLKLREFYLRNAATTAITGVAANFELFRFVSAGAPTGGTALTPIAHDSNDAVPAGMDARTGGTVSGELATPLDRIRMSTDEWGPGTADVESQQQAIANYLPARAKRDGLIKPFFARSGQGLHMKFATNSTAGSIDVIFVFTKV
jgi:hypothetical protein